MTKNIESLPVEQLLAIINKVSGYEYAVRVSESGSRVFVAQDESYIDQKDRWFNVAVPVFGHHDYNGKNTEITSHAKTLNGALAKLAEDVLRFKEKVATRYAEEAKQAKEVYEAFFNPPELCGASDSIPFEYTTLGDTCKNTLPCPKHGPKSQGPYR
jgi:hypothetical protein